MKKIEAIGIAQIAKEQLYKEEELSIHSRFENSMNLLSGSNLIYLGERALPFGLQIENFEDIKSSESVVYEDNNIIFTYQGIERYIKIDELDIIEDHHKGKLCKFKEKLELLKNYVELQTLKPLTYYLGRGQGLTPSGDDFLVGLYCVSFCNNHLQELMQDLKNIKFRDYTTTISAEYLEAARKGHFNPDLLELLACETKEEFENIVNEILAIGHSSGKDTLEGIQLGLNMIDKETKYEKENCGGTGW